jgi:hypothetical protein
MLTAGILARDHNAKRGGLNMGPAFIHASSMQQPLPGPVAATSSSSSKEPIPLPSLHVFGRWDKQDGQGGLRQILYASKKHTVDTLQGLMNYGLVDFPSALSMFRCMIMDKQQSTFQVGKLPD